MANAFMRPGEKFQFKGDPYVVLKTNPKNYRIKRLTDNTVYDLNRNAAGIARLAEADAPPSPTPAFTPHDLKMGQVVKFIDARSASRFGAGPFVVVGSIGVDRVRVAKLGGDGGRYVRANADSLKLVDVSDLV